MADIQPESGGEKKRKTGALWTARIIGLAVGAAYWPDIFRNMVRQNIPHMFGMPVGELDPDKVLPILFGSILVALGIAYFVYLILKFIHQVLTRQ
jgi:hypothetical protein